MPIDNTINAVPRGCGYCGYSSIIPKLDPTYDRYRRTTIVEARWVCPRCMQLSSQGTVSETPDAPTEKK